MGSLKSVSIPQIHDLSSYLTWRTWRLGGEKLFTFPNVGTLDASVRGEPVRADAVFDLDRDAVRERQGGFHGV